VRKAINENLPDGYEEGMQFGTEHMANYQAARALTARAVTRVKERLTTASPRPGFPVTDCLANGRAFQEQRKEGRGEDGETKEVTLATAGFVSRDMLTDPFFSFGDDNHFLMERRCVACLTT
jgi:hypothetical protein